MKQTFLYVKGLFSPNLLTCAGIPTVLLAMEFLLLGLSATGAVAGVGADVVMVAGELRPQAQEKPGGSCRRLINMKGFGSSPLNERNHY